MSTKYDLPITSEWITKLGRYQYLYTVTSKTAEETTEFSTLQSELEDYLITANDFNNKQDDLASTPLNGDLTIQYSKNGNVVETIKNTNATAGQDRISSLIIAGDNTGAVLQAFAGKNSVNTAVIGIGSDTNHDFEIRTNGTGKVRVLANGNVGINVSIAEAKLHTYEPSADNILLIDSPNSNSYDSSVSFRRRDTTVWNIGVDQGDSNKFKIANGGSFNNFSVGDKVIIDGTGLTTFKGAVKIDYPLSLDVRHIEGANAGEIYLNYVSNAIVRIGSAGNVVWHAGNLGAGTIINLVSPASTVAWDIQPGMSYTYIVQSTGTPYDIFLYEASAFTGKSIYFEALGFVSGTATTVYFALKDVTDGTTINGEITVSSSTITRARSASLSLTDGHTYSVVTKLNNASGHSYLSYARLIIK